MARKKILIAALMLTAILFSSCGSLKENTSTKRFYQAFVTRFNVYHNGNEAYKDGIDQQEKGQRTIIWT